MTLNVLNLIPDQSNYTLQMPTGVLSAQLDGGAPRTRADILGMYIPVTVQWSGDFTLYSYLQQAYRFCEVNGGAHFMIYLILDTGFVVQREAMWVHGSLKMISNQGDQYVVGANILVAPDLTLDSTWPADTHYQDVLTDELGDLLGT